MTWSWSTVFRISKSFSWNSGWSPWDGAYTPIIRTALPPISSRTQHILPATISDLFQSVGVADIPLFRRIVTPACGEGPGWWEWWLHPSHSFSHRQGDWRSQLSLLQPCIRVAHSKALCPQYMEWEHSIGQTGSLLHFPWEISGLGPWLNRMVSQY